MQVRSLWFAMQAGAMLEAAPVRVGVSERNSIRIAARLPAGTVAPHLPAEGYTVPEPAGLLATGVRPVARVV